MSLKKVFWISYDLGLKGDYAGLYTFLDSVGAKECGDNIGFFHKDYGSDFLHGLTDDLKKHINFTKKLSKNVSALSLWLISAPLPCLCY